MRKAIFIDKDGTLIRNVPYNVDPSLVVLESGAGQAICDWRKAGFLIIVISNQAGVAKGYFEYKDLKSVNEKLLMLVGQCGGHIDGFYYCPHHPDGVVDLYSCACDCRKPAPGLIVIAAKEWSVDLAQSWMIGDILNDVEAGQRAGCKTVLIDNGNETEWDLCPGRVPTLIVKSLKEAAQQTLTYSIATNDGRKQLSGYRRQIPEQ